MSKAEKRIINDPVERRRRKILFQVVEETTGEDGIVAELELWLDYARRFSEALRARANDHDVETNYAYVFLDEMRYETEILSNSLRDFGGLIERLNNQLKDADRDGVISKE